MSWRALLMELVICRVTASVTWGRGGDTNSHYISSASSRADMQQLFVFIFLKSAFKAQYCHFVWILPTQYLHLELPSADGDVYCQKLLC